MSSKGGSEEATTTSSSTQTPPDYLDAGYRKLAAQAIANADKPYEAYTGQVVADVNKTQQSAYDAVRDAQGTANPYLTAAMRAAGSAEAPLWNGAEKYSANTLQKYYNPYLTNVIDSTMANIDETNAQNMSALKGNAIQKGAWGGDRAGVAAAEMARQQGLARGQTLAALQNQGYEKAVEQFNNQQNEKLKADLADKQTAGAIAGTYGNLGNLANTATLADINALLASGNQQQAQAQSVLNVPYQQWRQQQAYPYQTSNYLASILQGLGGVAGGTVNGTSTSSKPSGGSLLGDILGGITTGVSALGNTGAFGSDGWMSNMFGSSGAAPPSGGLIPSNASSLSSSMNTSNFMGGVTPSYGGFNWNSGLFKRDGGAVPHMADGGLMSGVPDLSASYVPVAQMRGIHANFPELPKQSEGGGGKEGGGLDIGGLISSAASIASMFNKGGAVKPQELYIGGEVLPDVLSAVGDVVGSFFGMPFAGEAATKMLSTLTGGRTKPEGIATQAFSGIDDLFGIGGSGASQTGANTAMMFLNKGGVVPCYAEGGPTALEPNPWDSVMKAGLTMLASKSRNPMAAIGEGGLAGVNDWSEQKKRAFEEQYKNATLDQSAQKLAEEAEYHKGHLNNETAKLGLERDKYSSDVDYKNRHLGIQQQQADTERAYREKLLGQGDYTFFAGTGTDENGNQVQGSYKADQKTGVVTFMPGVSLSGINRRGSASPADQMHWAQQGADKELAALGGMPPNGETAEQYKTRRTQELYSQYASGALSPPVDFDETKPTPTVAPPKIPSALSGKKGVSYNVYRKQFKDAEGNIYDINGKPVK